MTLRRILANLAAGAVLVAILVGLVIIMVDERCSRAVSGQGKPIVQDIPFGGERK